MVLSTGLPTQPGASQIAPVRRLFVNGRFVTQPLSGVQRFAIEITAALLRRDPNQVTILAPPGENTTGLPIQVVGRTGGQLWEQLIFPAQGAGGVLINLGNTAPLRRRSQVVVIHDAGVFATPEAYSRPFRLWYRVLHAALARRGVQIATVSEFARSELVRWLKVDPDRISVISEGADHMHRITAEEAILRTLPSGRFVLVVGNLAAHKNLGALGILASRLAERGAHLVVTGGLAAGAFAAASALPQPAIYVGRVGDGALKALYQAAECLVFPSRYEGFGLPAVEAMACGCPVLASRIPALEETCGPAALYFDPSSPGGIAELVCRFLDDAGLAQSQRHVARARAAGFTWAAAADRLAAIAARADPD